MSEHYGEQWSGWWPSEERGWRRAALSVGSWAACCCPWQIKAASWREDGRQEQAPDRWSKALVCFSGGTLEMKCCVFFGLWRVWWLRPEGCEERSGVYVGGWVMGLNWSNAGDGDVISGKETPTIWQLQKITRSYKLIKSKKCIKSNITKVHSQPYECAVAAMSVLHWSVVMWNASNGLIC